MLHEGADQNCQCKGEIRKEADSISEQLGLGTERESDEILRVDAMLRIGG